MKRPHLQAAGRPPLGALCIVLIALCSALASCSKPSKDLQPGSYRATLELPGRKVVPFGLDVAREESGTVLYLVNGDERVRVTEVTAQPGRFTARMPGYENVLNATVAGGELRGELLLVHPDDRQLKLPFSAQLGETWRFFPEPLNDNADLAGRWDVKFTDDAGRTSVGVAQLAQRFADVTGTVIMPADDQRFLAGEVHDEELRLSRFDGGAVVLYEGRLNDQSQLVGEMWSDRGGHQRFVATRNPDASVDAAGIATQLRNPESGFEFAFKDLDGQVLTSSDPRFAGKVLLVTLAGSWCPNSHDEADALMELRRKYAGRGLEIVSLMFEQHRQFERAAAAVQRFRSARGIDYPTLIAGPMDKSEASKILPQLDAVRAYPTAIFIDRTGMVRKIHTGFAGPATGVEHELLVHEFEQMIERLLAEGSEPEAAPLTGPAVEPVSVPQAGSISP